MMSSSDRPMQGKVALVTGGSRGIGSAIADELIRQGCTVYISSITPGAAEKKASAFSEKYGVPVHALCFDVADTAASKAAVMALYKEQKQLDILVNNAGVMKDALIGMISEEDIHRVLDINVLGVINMLQLAAKLMMRAKTGSIINLSSIIGLQGNAGKVVYSASKGAVVALTKSAAKELGQYGIRVNAVAPGLIDTDMLRSSDERFLDEYVKAVALGRIGKPEDVANAVAFLASDNASYITGQVLGIDGGQVI